MCTLIVVKGKKSKISSRKNLDEGNSDCQWSLDRKNSFLAIQKYSPEGRKLFVAISRDIENGFSPSRGVLKRHDDDDDHLSALSM